VKRWLVLAVVLFVGLFCARMGYPYPATYDATGQRDVYPSGFQTDCVPPPSQRPDSTVYLIQNGNTATVVDVVNENTLLGTVSGPTYTLQHIWYEWDSGGWVIEDIVITASSTSQASGTDNWTWAGGGESCSGHYNGNQTFTISPNPGYWVQDVLVDGVSAGAVRTYTFTNVQVDHTIEALFERNAAMPWLQLLLGD
jgi:hypothetical protein